MTKPLILAGAIALVSVLPAAAELMKLPSQKPVAETIDALQYFGDASGQHLIDWGMDKAQVPEPTKEYQIEAWVIGPYVIKAVLNADPLARGRTLRPAHASLTSPRLSGK